MNSHASGQQPDDPASRDDASGGRAIGLVLLAVLLLAAFLVGVFFWDTWTTQLADRQTAGKTRKPETDRGIAKSEMPPCPADANRAAEPETDDVQQMVESQPSAAENQAIESQSAASPPEDRTTTDPPPPEPGSTRRENDDTQALAALEPFEVDGVERDGGGPDRPVSISGTRYDHAICVDPSPDEHTAQITFSLKGKWTRLGGVVGITGSDGESRSTESNQPKAVFRIYGDANLLWESKPLAGDGALEKFEVDVAQLDILALVVESQSTSDEARPVWADLRLAKHESIDSTDGGDTGQP